MRRALQIIRFLRVLIAARVIQDFLFNDPPGYSDRPECFEAYLNTMQKRIECLRRLDRGHPSWRIEARKRLLQLSTVAVAGMELLDTRRET